MVWRQGKLSGDARCDSWDGIEVGDSGVVAESLEVMMSGVNRAFEMHYECEGICLVVFGW